MFEWLSDPAAWVAFLTLCSLEIVLGIDNIIFITILAGKLPPEQQDKARQLGIGLALVLRLGLLFSIKWIMGLTAALFTVNQTEISGRDVILILGGLFLIYKAVKEIHHKVEEAGQPEESTEIKGKASFAAVIAQILLVDLVFSLDSVITAVGMVNDISIMVAAVVVSVGVMLLSAKSISGFVQRHPAVKILALAFLVMIGTTLIAEGVDFHIPKGYVYVSMLFAVCVEWINIRIGSRKKG
jgi:predicted tellurium resistance membrane protein TerC